MTTRKTSVSKISSSQKKTFRSTEIHSDNFEFDYNPDLIIPTDIIIADTSAVIDSVISASIKNGRYKPVDNDVLTVIIPEAVLAELENQADSKRETGVYGIDELLILRQMDEEGQIQLKFEGNRPTVHQIKDAKLGEVDALIRQTAMNVGGLFVTADKVQAIVGKARGLNVDYVPPVIRETEADVSKLSVLSFFDNQTMSVHLKTNVMPMAKRGSVGEMKYVPIRETICTAAELEHIKSELVHFTKIDAESFIEMEYTGALILQVRDMRIAITESPFSDDFEITIVRPIANVDFEKYQASDVLKERILQQRGVLIAGSPGAGKSTFSASVAKFLLENGNVVKTMESPRDLQVPTEITQYAPLEGKMENTADLLLLVRPDYTIYDEVRKTQDFMLFADMRLAGVGMIGVVHATRAIDAVQRLIGRIELGVIPQVVDTVIFIDKGQISKVYTLEFTVKVPHGMMEADLARPVIVVSDISSGKTEFEIYTYGEQVVVMPVGPGGASSPTERKPFWAETEEMLAEEVERYTSGPFEVELVSDTSAVVKVKTTDKKKIIGRGGDTINRIEANTGLRIDVREMPTHYFGRKKRADDFEDDFSFKRKKNPVRDGFDAGDFHEYGGYDNVSDAYGNNPEYVIPIFEKTKKHFILKVPEFSGKDVDVYISENPFFSATVGRGGDIKLRSDSELVEKIKAGFRNGELIEVRLSENKDSEY
ncbi:PINc/VapC family ATPase [Methanimicrococcus blatticola]|uniref:PilT family ATPase n=1 Tax=Methanimicrococcus blatticola TaxID=91560 RepID=A0A484F321_9EURY|nr:PINc/VapC family ATPase [Methanimicrococcus blatticola]MBZ3936010.1 PINc/VapC family ATPase [Methanimicrococcus blatticola]MCC2509377.1 PINc/VapC family ATPase [Methanimicrococcus blatticola]TDQ68260.1 PilT family ATPase [Methanimicrococcus blatticola]